MNTFGERFATLLGRILLALIFVVSGYGKIRGFGQTASYMASKGLPMVQVLLVLTILIEVGGGLMIILGWHARLAALAIFLFLLPVTFVFHAFWAVDPAQLQNQMNHFMKNLCIMGGMLYIIACGPGAFSLERPPRRR
jgi:putative oxidoreductase